MSTIGEKGLSFIESLRVLHGRECAQTRAEDIERFFWATIEPINFAQQIIGRQTDDLIFAQKIHWQSIRGPSHVLQPKGAFERAVPHSG